MTRRSTEPLPRRCDGLLVAVSLFTIAIVSELLSKRLALPSGVRSIIVNRIRITALLYLFGLHSRARKWLTSVSGSFAFDPCLYSRKNTSRLIGF